MFSLGHRPKEFKLPGDKRSKHISNRALHQTRAALNRAFSADEFWAVMNPWGAARGSR